MAGKGKATTITPPMIQAAARGLNTITGADQAWMSPGNPLPAMVPSATGRQYDYSTAVNLNITPRSEEGISFGDLRALADAYYLVRLAIETRKDQLEKLRWVVKPTDDKVKPDQRCKDLTLFFKKPDQRHGWREWLRMIVEDVLVIDAPAVYYHENMGDKPYAFEIIDGATIKVLLDQYGRQPVAPDPAYQQIIKGIPTVNYTTQELVYKPRNPRSWKAYGLSPVEQIITIVNIGLRRELSQLQFYTEGNIPEAIAGTPETWNPDQIAAYQKYWDSLLEGNTGNRRHMKFVPGGMNIHETKSASLTDAFDEWLARVVQYCFSLPATPYLKQVNKGETTNMKEQAEEEGLAPIMLWVEDFVNHLISTYWGYDDIQFAWEDEKSIDPLVQAQIDQIYITTDVVEKNEVRASLGLEARDYDAEAEKKLKAAQAAMPPAQPGQSDGQGNPPPNSPKAPNAKKDGAITNKHDHSADVKKKTYAALSPSNLKKAAKIASAFKKHFIKIKPEIIYQITNAYDKLTKSDDATSLITAELEVDFTAVLKVTAKNLNAAAREGADRGADLISMQYDGELDIDTKKIAEGVGDYNAAELVTNIDETTRDMLAGDIDDAFKEGWSSATLANKLEENYAFSDSRAETIARTEIARADQEGSMKAYRASGVVHNKAWLLAEEPCAICEENENDGIIGIDELFSSGDDAAPAHPNCFLGDTSISAFNVTKSYKRWFEGQIIQICVEGKNLSVTPNHPVLTLSGFIPANKLKVGDFIFQCAFPNDAIINPNNNHIESLIKDVPDSLIMASGGTTATMPTSSEHFHGDGIADSEVNIVNSACSLGNNIVKVSDDIKNGNFAISQSGGIILPCRSSLEQLIIAAFSSTDSVVSSNGSGSGDGTSGADSLMLSGLTKTFYLQTGGNEGSAQSKAMAADSFGDSCAGLAVSVTLVKIIDILEIDFSGHVYNLETVNGWFVAESIITSNCECTVTPIVDGTEDDNESEED